MMKDSINRIVDAMCVPGPVEMQESDFSFLKSCKDYNIYECCEDSVQEAAKLLSKYDFSGVKNVALTICVNEHDRKICVSEIGELKSLLAHLDEGTNVLWGFGFEEVETGKRKVKMLLAK